MDVWILVVAIFIVGTVGTGIGFWLWYATKPKRMKWVAHVYQLGEGIRKPDLKNKNGMDQYTLQNLQPLGVDILERVEKKSGANIYLLKRLKKPTPEVTADCVENWGKRGKIVHVLLKEDSTTLLKLGYDKKLGEKIFEPLPYATSVMIKTEMTEKKERIQSQKDIMQSLTPWIVTGLWALSLVIITYFMVQGYMKVSDNLTESARITAESQKVLSGSYQALARALDPELKKNETLPEGITKEDPPMIPP